MLNIPYSKIGYRIIQCRKRNCHAEVKTIGNKTKYCQKHGNWKPELEKKRQQAFAQELPKKFLENFFYRIKYELLQNQTI